MMEESGSSTAYLSEGGFLRIFFHLAGFLFNRATPLVLRSGVARLA